MSLNFWIGCRMLLCFVVTAIQAENLMKLAAANNDVCLRLPAGLSDPFLTFQPLVVVVSTTEKSLQTFFELATVIVLISCSQAAVRPVSFKLLVLQFLLSYSDFFISVTVTNQLQLLVFQLFSVTVTGISVIFSYSCTKTWQTWRELRKSLYNYNNQDKNI